MKLFEYSLDIVDAENPSISVRKTFMYPAMTENEFTNYNNELGEILSGLEVYSNYFRVVASRNTNNLNPDFEIKSAAAINKIAETLKYSSGFGTWNAPRNDTGLKNLFNLVAPLMFSDAGAAFSDFTNYQTGNYMYEYHVNIYCNGELIYTPTSQTYSHRIRASITSNAPTYTNGMSFGVVTTSISSITNPMRINNLRFSQGSIATVECVILITDDNYQTVNRMGYYTFQCSNYVPSYNYNTYAGIDTRTPATPIETTSSAPTKFNTFTHTVIDPPSGDPFAPGGTSDVGGGGGAFDDTSDVIADSALPTLSAANTGFTRIYNPTLSQVQALANYLWTDTTVIDTIWNHIKQFLEDPMDAFIAFNLVPCSVPDGGTQEFKVMYVPTGVMMTVAANQFVDIDCGTLAIENYYGSALDYAPYTKISVFLPYIGTVPLDCDEVMGKTLTVKYRIDIVSGACVAKIAVDGNYIYQYSGHCAINIPFTSADFTGYVAAIIQAARAAGAIAGGAGAAIAAATPAPEQQTGRMTASHTRRETERNPKSGRQITMSTVTDTWMRYDEPEQKMTAGSFAGLVAGQVSNTVGAVANSKPVVEHSGSFSGNSGYLGVRRPFAIIERPRMCNPSEYGVLNGYPSMLYRKLGDLSGFTQVQQIQLTGMTCTNPELAEIYTLLKSGVII